MLNSCRVGTAEGVQHQVVVDCISDENGAVFVHPSLVGRIHLAETSHGPINLEIYGNITLLVMMLVVTAVVVTSFYDSSFPLHQSCVITIKFYLM